MFQSLSRILDGKKTYIGITITTLGFLGLGHLVTGDEIGQIIDLTTQLVGLVITIVGRYKAGKKMA